MNIVICDGCHNPIDMSTAGKSSFRYILSIERMPSIDNFSYTVAWVMPPDPSGEYCSVDCLLTKLCPEQLDTMLPTM